jgi:transposase
VISTHKEKTMGKKRRNITSQFKAKVALSALKGDKTLAELSAKFDVHPDQIAQWKRQLLGNASELFIKGEALRLLQMKFSRNLHAKICQLTVENVFCPTYSVARSGTTQRKN